MAWRAEENPSRWKGGTAWCLTAPKAWQVEQTRRLTCLHTPPMPPLRQLACLPWTSCTTCGSLSCKRQLSQPTLPPPSATFFALERYLLAQDCHLPMLPAALLLVHRWCTSGQREKPSSLATARAHLAGFKGRRRGQCPGDSSVPLYRGPTCPGYTSSRKRAPRAALGARASPTWGPIAPLKAGRALHHRGLSGRPMASGARQAQVERKEQAQGWQRGGAQILAQAQTEGKEEQA